MVEAPSACPTCGRPLTGWAWHCDHPQCDWIRWDGCGHLLDLTRKGEALMANELVDQSSNRNGATVLWITIHTAEGPTDEFPSRPDLDAGSARDLLRFFQGKTDRSCHAIADDDVLLDDLVPYDRAAWTLRNGNRYSDNLEMCGLASWSRAEWLVHKGMVDNAARWVAARCKARGITPARLSGDQVAAKDGRGYIDHWTYTRATGDGTHWDVGGDFPWDYFGPRVQAFYDGTDPQEDDVSYEDAYNGAKAAMKDVLHIDDLAIPAGQSSNNRLALALFGRTGDLKAAVDALAVLVRADESTDAQATTEIVGMLEDVKALLPQSAPAGFGDPTPEA